ncbi:LysR family transcriptional regulator [Hypericibacter adhaerens]|jgi:LysR family nitrogen assimilation transcriptional regulator|uniref:LysR family transcriptional regulator n=1 Tax=Hypericibacter adhaerens TaxID=2602016 RepID=A0A5J6N4W4_9PROT|nr:LysR family transcriptional regulator [Hypericibacter adhaerens]QEX24457.1 LysR family transcriptional regulator [Hypericibacter adhaerens]
MPSLRQLRNFTAIAEVESLSKAATLIGVVPSALSTQLSALEKELGCTLARRDGRGVHLTQEGLELLYRARKILRSVAHLESEMRNFDRTADGEISVGLLPSLTGCLSAPLLAAIGNRFPRVRLKLREILSGDLAAALAAGHLDLATLYKHQVRADYLSIPLFTEPLLLAGPHNDAIFKRNPVGFRDIAMLPLILPSPQHGLRFIVDAAAASVGQPLDIRAEVDSFASMKSLLAQGFAFAILPQRSVDHGFAEAGVSVAPIDNPPLKREIVLAQPAQHLKSATVSVVAKLIAQLAPLGQPQAIR